MGQYRIWWVSAKQTYCVYNVLTHVGYEMEDNICNPKCQKEIFFCVELTVSQTVPLRLNHGEVLGMPDGNVTENAFCFGDIRNINTKPG